MPVLQVNKEELLSWRVVETRALHCWSSRWRQRHGWRRKACGSNCSQGRSQSWLHHSLPSCRRHVDSSVGHRSPPVRKKKHRLWVVLAWKSHVCLCGRREAITGPSSIVELEMGQGCETRAWAWAQLQMKGLCMGHRRCEQASTKYSLVRSADMSGGERLQNTANTKGLQPPLPMPKSDFKAKLRSPMVLRLTLQLEITPSPPAQIMLVFTTLPHQSGLEQIE